MGSIGRASMGVALGLMCVWTSMGSLAAGEGGEGTRTEEKPAAKVEVKETKPVVDETQVYYGTASTCRHPATVDADRVFRRIPEYKTICDESLTEKDARYSLLLLKATRKFKAAVESAALEGGQDLVANSGAVTWEGHTVPDITDTVLRKLDEAAQAAK